jgi:hypothetical protein
VIVAAIIANAILGGIWRRVLGGWFGLRRSYIVAAGALLCWPFWVAFPPLPALAATVAMLVFFTMGHRFDKPWTICLRYPLAGAIYPLGKRFWPTHYTSVAEIVIGAFYWAVVASVLFLTHGAL